MAHPTFGTTTRKESLFEQVQNVLLTVRITKKQAVKDLETQVYLLGEDFGRLELLKTAVELQLALLRFCNVNKINLSRGLENYIKINK